MASLGEDYPIQQARCREVLTAHKDIGPVGWFDATMIEAVLNEADEAAISGDLLRMIRAYRDMVEVK